MYTIQYGQTYPIRKSSTIKHKHIFLVCRHKLMHATLFIKWRKTIRTSTNIYKYIYYEKDVNTKISLEYFTNKNQQIIGTSSRGHQKTQQSRMEFSIYNRLFIA